MTCGRSIGSPASAASASVQPVAFRRAGGVVVHRLVGRKRHVGDRGDRGHAPRIARFRSPLAMADRTTSGRLVRADRTKEPRCRPYPVWASASCSSRWTATMVHARRGAPRAGPAGDLGGADRRRRRAPRPCRWGPVRLTCSSCSAGPTPTTLSVAGHSTPTGRVAIFVKEPTAAAVARAVALGTAVVAVEPRARWEHLYRLVNHAFEHHGDRSDPLHDSGTDLFGLAQSIADRTRGMICIEDVDSRMLAYSASSDEADELRRLTILGRAGPPEHLEWIGQWGIFDALRARPRRGPRRRASGAGAAAAAGGRHPSAGRRAAPAPGSPAPSGCSRARRRWPTTPRTSCAAGRCWRLGSSRGWRRHRRSMPPGSSSCSG